MKISLIGAGNVGSLSALRIAQEGLGDIVLLDIAKGLARAKALDLEDARQILKYDYNIEGSEEINKIKKSDIIVVTAGLARKPGMAREELVSKNAAILKEVCLNIKELAPDVVVIIVTNPLDLMTYFALKVTGFEPNRVFGMGISLDASRFANLISKELNIPVTDIETNVIGSHGEGMLPLPGHTRIKGVKLDEFLDDKKIEELVKRTVERGAQILSLSGAGSAYFAPSAAITQIVRAVAKDEKRILGVSAYLNGEYELKDICLGVNCRLGKNGIEQIVELELTEEEKKKLRHSAESLRQLAKQLPKART
ncbi:MAG: malate dehydrogenase [Candidatus Omnitrophota bacterium]|nr:malate dehydrogenase [Candidatus Omnitrophota bacterium]